MILLSKKENHLILLLFFLLWAYTIARAFTVFYVHDEIVSKWTYMIDWNFLPYEGYIDANNHFLNSLLGGLFIRLFNSDSMFVVRLANLLCFPIYFWSIVGFKKFFRKKSNFYFLLIGLCSAQFIIDFYSLARGYGMAWSFLLFAILSSAHSLHSQERKWTYWTIIGWLLCIYANLSYLPLAVIALVYMLSFSILKKKVLDSIAYLISFLPIYYFVEYSFELQSIGKLYLGAANHFFETVIHPLSEFLFFKSSIFIDGLLVAVSLIIVVFIAKHLKNLSSAYSVDLLFPILFCLTILSVFMQNWILGVNYPENRSATHLYILLIGATAFTTQYNWTKKVLQFSSLTLGIFFVLHLNFTHTQVYAYEHFDPQLLMKIPETTKGIPSSVGGRSWTADNELARKYDLPLRANQDSPKASDTLVDYLVTFELVRPNILDTYHEVYVDPISNLTLYQRNQFLERTKTEENTVEFDTQQEFVDLINQLKNRPCFIRCSGKLEGLTIYKDPSIIFTVEDSLSQEKLLYQGVGFSSNAKIDEHNEINFDFSFAIKDYPSAKQIKVYLYNKAHDQLKGEIKTEVYDITF